MRRWTLNPLVALYWQHFDGDWVIYDEGSGQTFVVDALMAAALMALESGCATEPEIAQQIVADMALSDLTGTAPHLLQMVQGLEFMAQMGVLEAVAA